MSDPADEATLYSGKTDPAFLQAIAALDNAIREKLSQIEMTYKKMRNALSEWEQKVAAGGVLLDDVAHHGTLMDRYYDAQKKLQDELYGIAEQRAKVVQLIDSLARSPRQ